MPTAPRAPQEPRFDAAALDAIARRVYARARRTGGHLVALFVSGSGFDISYADTRGFDSEAMRRAGELVGVYDERSRIAEVLADLRCVLGVSRSRRAKA